MNGGVLAAERVMFIPSECTEDDKICAQDPERQCCYQSRNKTKTEEHLTHPWSKAMSFRV
jgi:hypothetical protein